LLEIILLSIIFFFLSALMGYSLSWSKNSEGNQKKISLFELSTLGICFSLVVCGVIYNFGSFLSNQKMASSLVLLITITFGTCFKAIRTGGLLNLLASIIKKVPTLAIVSITFVTIYSGGFTNNPDLRVRNGPDIVGWLSSAQYFEKHSSLQELEAWLSKEFPNHPKIDAFAKSSWGTKDSIFATAAFTKQAQSEFLIGADRVAIPAFLALISEYFPQNINIFEIYLALSSLLMLLLLLWILDRVKNKKHYSYGTTITFSITILLFSYQLLLPIFEGGFGQHFSFIMFAFLLNKTSRLINFESILVFCAVYFAYKDLVIFAAPFLVSHFLLFRTQSATHRYLNLKKLAFTLGLVTLTTTFTFGTFIVERMRSISFGGWEEGFMPSIFDIFGLSGIYSWSLRGSENLSFSLFSIIMTCSLSVLILRRFNSSRVHVSAAIVLVFYLLLWLISTLNQNNYSMWKSLPYFSIFFASILSEQWKINGKDLFARSKHLKLVASIQTITALVFYFQVAIQSETKWVFSLDSTSQASIKSIIDNYAIEFKGVNPQQSYALLGDMEWGSLGRQIPNQPAIASLRPIAYSIPVSICTSATDKTAILFLNGKYCFVHLEND
jgi:hypothetical protein